MVRTPLYLAASRPSGAVLAHLYLLSLKIEEDKMNPSAQSVHSVRSLDAYVCVPGTLTHSLLPAMNFPVTTSEFPCYSI